jgi:hypothetical protein
MYFLISKNKNRELFGALDRCEDILSRQRYMCGPSLTEADVRLFQTLIRFDEVYVVYFKTNKKFIREYPNLREYVKELYQVSSRKRRSRGGELFEPELELCAFIYYSSTVLLLFRWQPSGFALFSVLSTCVLFFYSSQVFLCVSKFSNLASNRSPVCALV